MNGILKVLTAILGVLAVIACLATIGIVGYSMTNTSQNNNTDTGGQMGSLPSDVTIDSNGNLVVQASAVPTMTPVSDGNAAAGTVPTPTPASADVSNHAHD